jgi:hypothetical protein
MDVLHVWISVESVYWEIPHSVQHVYPLGIDRLCDRGNLENVGHWKSPANPAKEGNWGYGPHSTRLRHVVY